MFKKLVSSVFNTQRSDDVEARLSSVFLPHVPFLQGASEALIKDLASAIIPVAYKEGEVIFEKGDAGDSLFLVSEGSVRVTDGEELIARLETGGCFGEGAMLSDGGRGATVTACEPVTLYELKRHAFEELTAKHRGLGYRFKKLHKNRRAEEIENSIERNLLKNAPFLEAAGGDLINELAKFLKRKGFAEGEELVHEGERGDDFFLIESGRVEVIQSGERLAELSSGACFGEGVFFSREPRSATVRALEPSSCFLLGRDAFLRIIERYPVFGRRIREIHMKRKEKDK